ncbi:MAG TPA: hypothetical protein VNG51_19355 [Ktedonobacteraceae bacterium]|nr:hypothetical protein [Ktedonobacteraceae bacterium]
MQGNAISSITPTGVARRHAFAYDEYLTFSALGGMLVSDTGTVSSMTTKQFCEKYNVNEATTWRWRREHGFAEKVRARRDEVVPLARETAAWNRLYLIGVSSLGPNAPHHDQRAAVDALKTYLGHHGLRTPVQRQDIKVQGGLMDVLAAAERDGILEGEVVEPTEPDS